MKYLVYFLLPLFIFSCNQTTEKSVEENISFTTDPNQMADTDLQEIKSRDTLVALTGYNSLSYFIYKGQTLGFEYELLERLAQDLDLNLKIKVVDDMDQVVNMLHRGEGDLIAHNLTVTGDRNKVLNFTLPITHTKQVLIQRKPTDWRKMPRHKIDLALVRTPKQLAGKKILVRKESSYYPRLQNLKEESGIDFEIIAAPGSTSTEHLIKQVATGTIDFTVADENIADISTALYPNIDVNTPISLQQEVAWAVRKNAPELQIAVNQWLEKMQKGSDYYVIYNKYFKQRKSLVRKVKSPLYARNSGIISEYDSLIKINSSKIDWDWRMVASLVYQESKFDPKAKSWVGAKGLMQMMPTTAKQFKVKDLTNPKENVQAGTQYLADLDDFWSERIPDEEERKKFIMASYNAGPGHVLDAQRLAVKYEKDPNIWFGNVADLLRKKSKPEYYNDPVVRHGFCRGEEPYKYVKQILTRFEHYKQFTEPISEEFLALN